MDSEHADEHLGKAINQYLNHYVLVIDGKAAAVAAGSLVLVGFVVASEANNAVPTARFIGALLASIAAIFAGIVLYPRTPHSGNGHMFWGDIASFDSASSYWKSLSTLSEEAIGLEYARQNFNVSDVLNRKIRGVQRAIWAFAFACLILAYAYGAR